MKQRLSINILVEGIVDEAVANRLIAAAGHNAGYCYGKNGIGYIRNKVAKFNESAKSGCYLTLVDFIDTSLHCPPEVVANWLPYKHQNMIFRVVVREMESWLLADREGISHFLKVSLDKIPLSPEGLPDPKQSLVNLARKSNRSSIRSALVPEAGSTAQVGKLYSSEIIRFASNIWNPEAARLNSPSLDSCLRALVAINEK